MSAALAMRVSYAFSRYAFFFALSGRGAICLEQERWAVVTGASSGIGRAIASAAAAHGFSIVATARSAAPLEVLKGELSNAFGVSTVAVACDLSKADCLLQLLSTTRLLQVDLLVANAGFSWTGDFVDHPEAGARSMLDLNLGATISLCRSFGAVFAKARRGSILISGSLTGLAPLPGAAVYGATKAS